MMFLLSCFGKRDLLNKDLVQYLRRPAVIRLILYIETAL